MLDPNLNRRAYPIPFPGKFSNLPAPARKNLRKELQSSRPRGFRACQTEARFASARESADLLTNPKTAHLQLSWSEGKAFFELQTKQHVFLTQSDFDEPVL